MDLERTVDIFDQVTHGGVALDDEKSVQNYRDRTEHMLADVKKRLGKLREAFKPPAWEAALNADKAARETPK